MNPLEGHPTWERVRDISRGASGTVLLGRNKQNGEEAALKLIERGQKITSSVEAEILNHKKLVHPHVISLHGVDRTDSYLVLILEYAAGGSLRSLLAKGRLPESEARRLFQQLILGVDYCHQMGVSNRDVKPDNVLLDENGDVKLADFGYSKDDHSQSMANTRLGTPAYTAPEIFRLIPAEGEKYNAKQADVWSCGVTLFELVTGSLPFKRPEDTQLRHVLRSDRMMERLLNGDYHFPPDVPLSDGIKDLIGRMLRTDPKERITVKEISKNAWFKQEGLPQGAFHINLMLVTESKQSPPSDDDVAQIKETVREAQKAPALGAGGLHPGAHQRSIDMESFPM